MRTTNREPLSIVLSTRMVPPCRRTSSWVNASPIPVPSCVRDFVPSTRWKRSKIRDSSDSGMPAPVSMTSSSTASPLAMKLDANGSAGRELQRVRQQIEDNLFPHVAIEKQRLLDRVAHHVELESGTLDRRPKGSGKFTSQSRHVSRCVRRLHPARFDSGKIEQRVDQLQQPAGVPLQNLDVVRCGVVSEPVGPASRFSIGPSINVNGVRNSWLTLLKNVVFARSMAASASARCRSSSYAVAFATAVPSWSATRSRKLRYSSSNGRRGLRPTISRTARPPGCRRRDREGLDKIGRRAGEALLRLGSGRSEARRRDTRERT